MCLGHLPVLSLPMWYVFILLLSLKLPFAAVPLQCILSPATAMFDFSDLTPPVLTLPTTPCSTSAAVLFRNYTENEAVKDIVQHNLTVFAKFSRLAPPKNCKQQLHLIFGLHSGLITPFPFFALQLFLAHQSAWAALPGTLPRSCPPQPFPFFFLHFFLALQSAWATLGTYANNSPPKSLLVRLPKHLRGMLAKKPLVKLAIALPGTFAFVS